MSATATVPSNWNVANGLTALRIALVPLFAALLLHDDGTSTSWRIAAAVAFGAAVLTDRIDGELARNWDMVTDLGKIADPIADKALIGAALLSLSGLGELWWWVTATILVREIGITLLRLIVIRHGVMPAGRGGKAKTAAQALAIMLYVVPLADPVHRVAELAMAVALVLTVVTGLDYVVQAVRLREGSERTKRKRAARRARALASSAGPAGSPASTGGATSASVASARTGGGSGTPASRATPDNAKPVNRAAPGSVKPANRPAPGKGPL